MGWSDKEKRRRTNSHDTDSSDSLVCAVYNVLMPIAEYNTFFAQMHFIHRLMNILLDYRPASSFILIEESSSRK